MGKEDRRFILNKKLVSDQIKYMFTFAFTSLTTTPNKTNIY